MNKIIALFVALAVFSSAALFAAPVSGAPGAAPASQTEESFEVNALFADVEAPQLSDTEAEAIEGAGLFAAILGVICSGFTAAVAALPYGPVFTVLGALGGAIYGGYIGWTQDTVKVSLSL